MPLALVGTLPVSAINVGLAASAPTIGIKVGQLAAEIAALTPAIAAQIQVAASPPAAPLLAGLLKVSFSPASIAVALGGVQGSGGLVALELGVKIGALAGQIAAVGTISDQLSLGLDAGGIASWNYAGRAAGFGESLESATALGFGKFGPKDNVAGVVLATENFGSWGSFSQGFNTGASSTVPVEAGVDRLVYMGSLDGKSLNVGVAGALADINVFLGQMKGEKGGLEGALQASLGLELPDPQVLIDAGLAVSADLGVEGILENLTIQADITGSIGAIQAKIDALVEAGLDLSGQLSAGGLSVWSYSGTAAGFGSALRGALQNGLPSASGPGAKAYGLALAGSAPTMSVFGGIFLTG
jgi:hypothetical protein